jgi:biotin carboxyl carrier protein
MQEVVAQMPGMVVEIMVNVGDKVIEDQELLIIEAMKMENPIFSPAAGQVKEIVIKKGDKVESGDVLMKLE